MSTEQTTLSDVCRHGSRYFQNGECLICSPRFNTARERAAREGVLR